MKKAILLICLTIFLFMGLQNWEGLQKNTTDTETIEQAIARLIAVHEADSTSHLGEGESLQAHKNADVIDHPAQSLVPDKFSNKQSFLYLPVVPYDSGAVDNFTPYNAMPFLNMDYETPRTGGGSYAIADFIPYDLGYADGDVIFDFMIQGYGSSGTWQNSLSFGFGEVQLKYGYYRIGYWTTSMQYSSWIAYDVSKPLRFRFSYDSLNNELNVYLKENLVFSVSYTWAADGDEFNVIAHINRNSSSTTNFFVGNLLVWFDGF